MKRLIPAPRYCLVFCLLGSLSAFANPNPPSAYAVLSEIQITDSLHWNVEVDASVGGMSYDVRYPGTTDSFFLYCSLDQAMPPTDLMRKPAIGEVFDSKGIAVLTPSHFPGLKLRKGETVFLTFGNATIGMYGWKTQIPSNITSAQSVVGSNTRYCCEYLGGSCVMYCPRITYSTTNTPTIGALNAISPVVPWKKSAPEASSIRLIPTKERRQIIVAVSGQAGNTGTIDLFTADGVLFRSLRLTCRGPGTYTVRWDGNNEQGQPVPAGTYICRVKVGEHALCQGFIAW
jgi:hypothetical protein